MTKKKYPKGMTEVDYLSGELFFMLMSSTLRPKKMVLKGGYGDWLLVITAVKDGQSVVCFVGSNSIINVARKVHQQVVDDTLEWKPDKFAD